MMNSKMNLRSLLHSTLVATSACSAVYGGSLEHSNGRNSGNAFRLIAPGSLNVRCWVRPRRGVSSIAKVRVESSLVAAYRLDRRRTFKIIAASHQCGLDFHLIFSCEVSMFPTPGGRKSFVVTCKKCRRDVPSGRDEFPFQSVAVACPLCGELRRYLCYSDHVYTRTRFTSVWLEEALADWSAHDWLLQKSRPVAQRWNSA